MLQRFCSSSAAQRGASGSSGRLARAATAARADGDIALTASAIASPSSASTDSSTMQQAAHPARQRMSPWYVRSTRATCASTFARKAT
jgi:hypothetical protein